MKPEDFPDISAMRTSASTVCGMLKVLANEDRLLILCQLIKGACNVGELEALLGIRQPTLSQQLTVLRDEGLVTTEKKVNTSIIRSPAWRQFRSCRHYIASTAGETKASTLEHSMKINRGERRMNKDMPQTQQTQGMTADPVTLARHWSNTFDVVVVGGGSAGIGVTASLLRRCSSLRIDSTLKTAPHSSGRRLDTYAACCLLPVLQGRVLQLLKLLQ
ncbi:regulatory ArsR family protein [Nitrosospira multiformis]|uniref:Regulatory ArsR family protein n=2 Tax=Nitrosospira multiformis TaxID=1231 RepID=A0A2T5I7V7_9PROT|nr:regulatory ArsR family protein [Nitrosospira multiformis]